MLLDVSQLHFFAGRTEVSLDAAPIARELFGVAGTDGRDLRTLQFARGQIMDHAHEADADDADANHCGETPSRQLTTCDSSTEYSSSGWSAANQENDEVG